MTSEVTACDRERLARGVFQSLQRNRPFRPAEKPVNV